jgi:cytoskeleton protein RodZ
MTEQEQPIESGTKLLSMRDVGKLLAEARANAALSAEDAASRLCLRPQQIEAIESGEVDRLPGQTFVRGLIRSYAKLLQIDAEPLVEAHRRHAPGAMPGQMNLKWEHIPINETARHGWLPYIQLAVVIGVLLGAGLAYMEYSAKPADEALLPAITTQPEPMLEEQSVLQPLGGAAEPGAANALPAEPPVPAATNLLPPAPPAGAATQVNPAALPALPSAPVAAVPAAAGAKLRLAFSDSSWVRVRDRDGRYLLNRTVSAGKAEVLTGTPPLTLEIGNTAGVQVSFNDKPVDLAPYTRANVARFTLE